MRRRTTVLALASFMFVLHQRPAIAQSSSTLERVSLTSVQQYVAGEAIPRQLALPPNLDVSALYRPLVEAMLRDSPTFRRQCLRIAAEPGLTVQLRVDPPPRRSTHRATTRLSRDAQGNLTAAVIAIGPLEDTQELIAHEFEHVIEQLDGVDLAARAALPHSGVILTGPRGAVYETTRAQRMGLKVVSELRP
jgi:YD repeat-containing protein